MDEDLRRAPGLRHLLSHDSSPLIQFVKYGIAGGVATAVSIVLFQMAAWWLWPCLKEGDILATLLKLDPPVISDGLRAARAMYANVFAFMIANMVAYLLNIKFVFKAGRHHWLVEIGLFYAVSGVSMVLGTLLMGWLIGQFGIRTDFAFFANIVTAVLINYAVRKFVIFKR